MGKVTLDNRGLKEDGGVGSKGTLRNISGDVTACQIIFLGIEMPEKM